MNVKYICEKNFVCEKDIAFCHIQLQIYWCATPEYFYDAAKGWLRRSKMHRNEGISFDCASARVISDIMSDMTKDQIEMKKPVYGKGKPRIGKTDNKDPVSITCRQMNETATEFFGE